MIKKLNFFIIYYKMDIKGSKKNGTNSKEIPFPKVFSPKQQEIDKQKLKNFNVIPSPKEITSSKEQNKIFKSVNNNIPQKKHINKTEAKEKLKRKTQPEIQLSNLNKELNKNLLSAQKTPEAKKNEKNNNNKNQDKNKIKESNSLKDMDSLFGDDNNNNSELTKKNILKSYNMNIQIGLSTFNSSNLLSETDINIKNKESKTDFEIPIKKSNSNNINKQKINPSKTGVQKYTDKISDILIPNNELEESKSNQKDNLKKTKVLKVSTNPFTTKIKKKALILNSETNKNISELKKNLKECNINNNNNLEKKEKEKELIRHMKSQTLNMCKSQTNQSSSIISSNIQSINSNSKKNLNSEFSENPNLENIYRKLLLYAKRGDREKFLEIYRQILSLEKNIINLNYKDENGNTALHYACDEGNLKIVEILLDANCETDNKNIKKETPLHLSAKRGYFDISKRLIESGANLNAEDSEKNSPLHYVCRDNYIELLKYFLTKNPKLDEKNIYGKTPKDLATNIEIKNLIDEYLAKNEKNEIKNNKANTNEIGDIILKSKIVKDDSNRLKNNKLTRNKENNNYNKMQELQKEKTEIIPKNKKHSGKNLINNVSSNIKKEIDEINNRNNQSPQSSNNSNKNCIIKNNQNKNDPNIYFQNTNNINNNNNININIYSINELKRSRADSNYKNKESNKKNNGVPINRASTSININRIKAKKEQQSKYERKSKFNQNNIKNIFDSIDYDKNIFNLNKTEENIITEQKNLNILNNSTNINYLTNTNKNNNNKNKGKKILSSKTIKSTEQLLPKISHINKKRESKFKPKNINNSIFKNVNDLNLTKITTSKNKKILHDIDAINRSNVVSSKMNKKYLNETSSSMEHISPSDFECLAQLGKGSFGEVYLVRKLNSSEQYAMKVLRKERILGQNLLKYALAERNVLSTNNHPFIVKLNYSFQTSTKLFLVLEYCPNGDLAKHLTFEKRFKEPRAKFYICEVILALEDLHKRNIIFRDLKPDNVVLDKDGHCKLTDFGLSKEGMTGNIYTQSFCGSIAYLAPEMLKKQGHGKAVDWYLLGVLFYEMLVGMTPFFTTKKEDIFYNIEYGELKIPNFVSKEASELLKRLLERNPEKRLGGCGRDAAEIKEHPYFKDVDWKKVYDKKIKPPNFLDYARKTIRFYNKPKLFANEDLLNRTDEKNMNNILKGWSFINKDEENI